MGGSGIGAQEERGHLAETVGILGGEIPHGTTTAYTTFNLGVAVQIVCKALGNYSALLHHGHAGWHILPDFAHQQRIMRAAEYHAVDVGAASKKHINIFLHEIIGTGAAGFVIFDKRNP